MRTETPLKSNDNQASVERADLFTRGVVLAETYFRPLRSPSDFEPERQLMMAVLKDAVHCVRTYCNATEPHGRELFLAEERWMLSGDRSSFFAFENICETLDLDPRRVRRATFA